MGQDRLTYDKNADAATGATGPTVGYEGGTVKVAENGFTRPGFRFTGWNTQPDGEGTGYDEGANYALTDGDDVLYAQWERIATPLTPKAVSLVAYEGGAGSSANPYDALPEPVWRFEAEGWTLYVDGVKQDPDAAAFQWGYFAAGSETEQISAAQKGVYELHAWPLEGDPEVVAQDSDGSWYILDLGGDTEVVDEEDRAVTVSVRDVVNGKEAEELSAEVLKPVVAGGGHAAAARAVCAEGGAHAHVAERTGFEKNGIDGLPVADPSQVSLLYDDLIPNVLGGADRMGALDEKARAAVGGEFASGGYGKDFKYLDLVDKSDGNLWVATADGSDTTVFIPYRGDMTADKTISGVRFTGLTRDYTVGGTDDDVDAAVSASSAFELDVVKSDGGITFTIPSGQFGPIELMWVGDSGGEGPDIPNPPVTDPDEPDDPDIPDEPDTPDEPDNPDEPDTPEPDEPDTPEEPDEPDTPDTPEPSEPSTPEPSEPTKPSNPEATIPQTGDALTIAAALSALAGTGVIGAGVAARRRRE
nr:InlB B-repeat-containing protein [Collinsella tanakaei]